MLIVFDLDDTLTDFNYGDSVAEAWETRANYDAVKQMLQQQRKDGHTLVILSRGVRRYIIEFLDNVKLLSLFDVIIGAKSISENRDNTDEFWGRLKTKYLKALAAVYGDEIIFLDDMLYNVLPARRAGFKTIHIKPPGARTTVKLMQRYLNSRSRRRK
jgi:HAD superfamily phosphatase (TIGR01681 family)